MGRPVFVLCSLHLYVYPHPQHILVTPLVPHSFPHTHTYTYTNSHNVDLNRNFPDPIELGGSAAAGGAGELSQAELAARLRKPLPNAEPETRALMDWLLSMQ